MAEILLRVVHLQKVFPSSRGLVHAVNDVGFEVVRGETFALVGESGSGKTTVGRCLLRLIQPTAGMVHFADQDITSLSPGQFRGLRHKMQMVFQEPHASLNPRLRVASIVEDPLRFGPPLSKEGRRERVLEVLSEVGLDAGYLQRYPHQLTGGEAQRVGIARAIVTSPDLVILDEPTSHLDISARAEIIDLLRTLQEQLGVTYLFISHDLTAVQAIADRVAVMYLGKILETGATEEMFKSQRHPYTRALLSATLFPDPTRRIPRFQLSGEIPSPMNLPEHCFLAGRCPLVIDRCREQIPPLEEVEPGRMAACLRWEDVAGARDSAAQEQSAQSEVPRQAARGGNK